MVLRYESFSALKLDAKLISGRLKYQKCSRFNFDVAKLNGRRKDKKNAKQHALKAELRHSLGLRRVAVNQRVSDNILVDRLQATQ